MRDGPPDIMDADDVAEHAMLEMRRERSAAVPRAAASASLTSAFAAVAAARREKKPVHDLDAETAVLGAILLDSKVLATVAGILKPEDFYHPGHALIYECMVAVDGKGLPIDIVTLANELRERERINTVGGAQYLGELTDAIHTTAWAETHAQLLADLSLIRKVQFASLEIYLRGFDHQSSDGYTSAAAELLENASRRAGGKGMVAPEDLACQISDELVAAALGNGPEAATSGLVDVDRILGLRGNKLIIIAARPGMGKTSLALLIAAATARGGTRSVMFFSLEMRGVELGRRFVSMKQGIPVPVLEKGKLTADQMGLLERGLAEWARAGVWVNPDDAMDSTIDAICAEIFRFKAAKDREGRPLAMVVIDYLQLIPIGKEAENTEKGIAQITRRLKAGVAKRLDIPVVLLSQLNRKCEERADKRPMMSDLRESGAIEQDADAVVFVYRDEMYNKNTEDKGIAEIIIAKQRAGPRGMVKVKFDEERTLFRDLESGEPPEGSYRDAGGVLRDEFGEEMQNF